MSLLLHKIELPLRIRQDGTMTDAEFERFCAANEPTRFERDANGEIIVMSPNLTEGGGIESDVFLELGIWAREDGRGRAYGSNTGFRLKDTSVRAADAMWVSWVRLNARTEEEKKMFSPLCPEFVVEVRSGSDRLKGVREKMEMWLGNGAELGWLIDPERKVVEVYRQGGEPEVHENPTSVQGTGPVRGFELVMGRVWG
jgi:Uma2 family endonuclease